MDPTMESTTLGELAAEVMESMATDLSTVIDRELEVKAPRIAILESVPPVRGGVHLGFSFSLALAGGEHPSCLVVPLPPAIALAGHLMMLPDDEVESASMREDVDGPLEDALLEVGKFLTGAFRTVLLRAGAGESAARFEGCRGLSPDERPLLPQPREHALVVARSEARLNGSRPFELALVAPHLPVRMPEDLSRGDAGP
jgi:hypothetical protein